jgi:high mobility group protein B1
MTDKEKQRFHDMAGKDKVRFDSQMKDYHPVGGKTKGGKAKKDPNAPKRAL